MGGIIFAILFIVAIIVVAFMKNLKDRKGKWHGTSLKGEMTGYRYQWYEPSEEEEKEATQGKQYKSKSKKVK